MNTVLYNAREIDSNIHELAATIVKDHAVTPIFVALLRGAAPFASKLMFEIAKQKPDYHPQLDYMTVSTYGQDHHAKTPQIIADISPDTDIAGRDVVVLDDTLDTGVTAKFVQGYLRTRGANTVQIAVLVNKRNVRTDGFEPDYAVFTAGPEWLIGMGLDDPHTAYEAYRWDSSIGIIGQD